MKPQHSPELDRPLRDARDMALEIAVAALADIERLVKRDHTVANRTIDALDKIRTLVPHIVGEKR